MNAQLKSWFHLPEVLKEDDVFRALRLIFLIVLSASLLGLVGIFFLRGPGWEQYVWISSLLLGASSLNLFLLRQKHLLLAILTLLVTFTGILTYAAWTGAGVYGTSFVSFIVIVVATAFFLGRRAGYVMAGLATLIGLTLLLAGRAGWLVNLNRPTQDIVQWVNLTFYFFIVAQLVSMVLKQSERSLYQARQELAERTRAEAKVRRLNAELEQRIAERTAQLAAREAHYRGAIMAAGLVPYEIDYQTKQFTFISEDISKLTGYNAQEITPSILKASVQEDYVWGANAHLTTEEARQQFLAGELTEWHSDMRIRTQSGESRWLSDSSVELQDEAGKAKGAVGIFQDITARKQAEEQIKESLREKELLLKEIHHRVKNNMQVIVSMMSLQSVYITDPQLLDIFTDSQNRVRSMALVHEKLYQSNNLAQIDFRDYLQHLASTLFHSYSPRVSNLNLTFDIGDITLGVDAAIPCGLMVNELVSNALKHAFPDQRAGKVQIGLQVAETGLLELKVADDGVGFPEGKDWRQTDSLGMQLVQSLVQQIHGTIEMTRLTPGTAFTIQFNPQV